MKGVLPILLVALASGCSLGRAVKHSVVHAPKNIAATVKAIPGASQRAVNDVISPPKGFARDTRNAALILPGGGWLYLDNADRPEAHAFQLSREGSYLISPSVGFMLATALMAAALANNTEDHGAVLGLGAGLVVVRFADILTAVRAAKTTEKK
jgi:hypothetical protein